MSYMFQSNLGNYTLHHTEKDVWNVIINHRTIGKIYKSKKAWSYAPWVIEGDIRTTMGAGTSSSKNKFKPFGYSTIKEAAENCILMHETKSSKMFFDDNHECYQF